MHTLPTVSAARAESALPPLAALASLLLLALALLDVAPAEPAAIPPASAAQAHNGELLAQGLAQRLSHATAKAPSNHEYATQAWALLARTQAVNGDWPAALVSFEQATQRAPRDAALWAERARAATALAARTQQAAPPAARAWVAQALQLDAAQPLALTLSGDWAYAAGDLTGAQRHWQAAQRAAQDDLRPRLEERLASVGAALAATHQALK